MRTPVHILATVRKPELLDAARLVFRTLRTGFPTAPVFVWGNALDPISERAIAQIAAAAGASYRNLPATSHDAWVEGLIDELSGPFWICDTDICFWEPVEKWTFPKETLFAGRHEIEFDEEWTKTRHMERIHTSLMWIDPAALRAAFRLWIARVPLPWRATATFPFIRQHFVPMIGSTPLFYDTMAGAYHALEINAYPFTETQNAAFDHLHCATYADVITLNGKSLLPAHQAIYNNPELARGLRAHQNTYYASRSTQPTPCHTIQESNHAPT